MIGVVLKRNIQLALVLFVAGALSGRASVRQSSVVIERDIRLFSVVAALNAAGFDVELGPQYHPIRQRLREELSDLDPDLSERLKAFYTEQRQGELDETQLSKYISLALNLTDPPDMVFERNVTLTPQDALEVQGFIPLLNEFFRAARITQLWSVLGPSYDAEIDLLAPRLRQVIVASDVYLRVPAGTSAGRQLVISLELGTPINTVNIRNYSDALYMVLGSSTIDPIPDVRHAYLHLLLDTVVGSNEDLSTIDDLLDLVEGVEGVDEEYVRDSWIMVEESLIRAVEFRMDQLDTVDVQTEIDQSYRQGLLLVPYFYGELERFEQGQVGIRESFPDMIAALSIEAETERFDDQFHSIASTVDERPRAEVPPGPDPVVEILARARDLFNSGENTAARLEFLRVIVDFDPDNGSALYGLALLASREQDVEAARDYFSRAIGSETAELPMRAWSHVYLGRIYDLECDRRSALEHYNLALGIIGDGTLEAQDAAQEAIGEPFGTGCELD